MRYFFKPLGNKFGLFHTEIVPSIKIQVKYLEGFSLPLLGRDNEYRKITLCTIRERS